MLCVCICLSSTVFCFADFTSTDSTTLSNIYRYMPTASQITTLTNTVSTISTRVLNILNALNYGDHSIAYWVNTISSWMSPIYYRINDILQATINPALSPIYNLLASSIEVDGVTQYTSHFIDSSGRSIGVNSGLIYGLLNRVSSNIYKNGNYITASYDSYGLATGSKILFAAVLFDPVAKP